MASSVVQLDNSSHVGVSNVVNVRAMSTSKRPTNAISFIPNDPLPYFRDG
jgi:hypothetical protein